MIIKSHINNIGFEIGHHISNKQRADEALALYIDFLIAQHSELLPCFILGDFNQELINNCLSYLGEQTETKQLLSLDYKLLDSFYISDMQQNKTPTHYYQGKGQYLRLCLCALNLS